MNESLQKPTKTLKMSQIEEENKQKRTVKLCQLIHDRQIDSEIGFEIRKLLKEGVLIDYRDQNRNQKTAIHLAVEKCDVICVKFLLRFKPNSEVADGDGKTPIELAESKGYQNILNALLNSTFDFVNESYVEVFDYKNLTRQKIEAIKSRPTFKVLKLINCPSANRVLKKITHRAYITTFNETSHLFFIAIETNETKIQNGHELMKKISKLRRPMIVQLTSSNSQKPKIYFKDEKMKDFVKITDTPQINQDEFDEAVQSDDECNMKLLVAALRSNLFGHFTSNLLGTKLNTTEDRSEAVIKFARSNALCHRFFKLFDESPPQIERIVATLSFKGDQSLLALLDLPFELNDEKLKLTEHQHDILTFVDDRGYNLLMMAAKLNSLDAFKLLLRCGCDFNHSDNDEDRASDICWEVKAFGCLAELIEAGSPYPNNFCLDELDGSSEAFKRITKMIEAINSFHANIEKGEIKKVKKFITSHRLIKHAYDTKNFCALTVALESDKVEIYSLLMSEGFEPGADDEYESALDEFENKYRLRKSHKKYFKEALNEPHLKRLVEKSKLSFGSKERAKCSTIIRKMFDELNKIEEIIPILQICSTSEKLRIVFDFNCDYVLDMVVETGSRSLGLVYPIEGSVYIGAKNHETEFCKVIGALIHELTHYAMKLTYENGCKPYDGDDTKKSEQFENVVMATEKICKANSVSTDSIVATVFTLYGKEVWHKELIVRVPQLLAHYNINSKALEAAERNTPELFHFYRETTSKDVAAKSKVLLQKYLISKINKQTGIVRRIKNLKVRFKAVDALEQKPAYVITSNAPRLTLSLLSQIFESDSHIFVTLEQIAIGSILEKLTKIKAEEISTALIVDCIGWVGVGGYQNYLQVLKEKVENFALVMADDEFTMLEHKFPNISFTHKWSELTESSKVISLNQKVIFQGIEMKLNELVEPSSEAMNFFPLGSLVDCKDFKIGHELHQTPHKFYILRKFIQKGQERSAQVTENAKSFEELLQNKSSMGAMIISDEAGSGKSVALFEIAKSLHIAFPNRWVLFVDLKRHIEAFKSVEDHEKIESVEDFILQNILKNEPEFDRELFLQMFRTGKTFVLLDGFDEISPNYKDLLLHVLKLFQPESGNQVFITTRPHLEADLKSALGKFVLKLEEFSKVDQRDFLEEYWKSVRFEISHDDLEVLSNRLFEKFSRIATSQLIGIPLLMRMTAEIFDDPIKKNLLRKVDSLSVSSVFEQFVKKYFARWTNNENEISRNESVDFLWTGGVVEVHHSIALNHKFGEKFMSFDVVESDAEKISRVGLIRFDKTEKTFQFIHETFAEYFVADFIWFHLNRKNRNPSHDCSKAVDGLVKVFLSYDVNTAVVIRNFLDQTLETMKFNPSDAFCRSVGIFLSEELKSKNRFDFLRKSFKQKNLASLLLSIIKFVEKEVLLKLLEFHELAFETPLIHSVTFESCAIVSTLCGLVTNCTDNPKEIFHRFEGPNGNILQTAKRNKNAGVLTTVCASLNSVFTKDEIKIMFLRKKEGIVRNIVVDSNTVEVLLELISLLPKYFSPDQMKSLLLEADGRNQNFFHRAVTHDTNENLKLMSDVVKLNFDVDEQKSAFYMPSTGPNIFHFAAQNKNEKIFETIIESTRDVLTGDETKSMLTQKDSDGSNMLHKIAEFGNEIKLSELNLLLREHLSDDEIRSLLLEVNSKGQNCFRLAANNTKRGLQVFCEIIGNLLPIEDQTRLLQESIHEIDIIRLACGNYTNEILPLETIKKLLIVKNVFNGVVKDGDVETWNKLVSFTRARFSADEMKSFLLTGKNCLQLAVSSRSHANMIEAICETIKSVEKSVLSVEDQIKFVRQKDSRNRNLFHLAVENLHVKPKLSALYDGLGVILSNDELKEMLKEKDSEGDNILRFNTKNQMFDFGGVSRDFFPFLREVLTNDEMKTLLLDVDGRGRNFFQYTVQLSSKFEIRSLSTAAKEILSHEDQKTFFGFKGQNVFTFAATNSRNGIFSTTHECLKGVMTRNEIKSLMQEKTSTNGNILHMICQLSNENVKLMQIIDKNYDDIENRLRDFFKVLKIVCDADELKNFLKSSDDHGSNCLLLAAQLKAQPFLKELFNFIQSELSLEDQRDLIQKSDNDEDNILTCASLNNVPEMFSFVENLLKEILSESQNKGLIRQDLIKRNVLLYC